MTSKQDKLDHLYRLRAAAEKKAAQVACPACGDPARLVSAHADRRRTGLCAGCYTHIQRDSYEKGGRRIWKERRVGKGTPYDSRGGP